MTEPAHQAPLWQTATQLAWPKQHHKKRNLRARLLALKAKAQLNYMRADQCAQNIEILGRSWSRLADHMIDVALKEAWAATPQANLFLMQKPIRALCLGCLFSDLGN